MAGSRNFIQTPADSLPPGANKPHIPLDAEKAALVVNCSNASGSAAAERIKNQIAWVAAA